MTEKTEAESKVGPEPYVPKTEDELRQLAIDLQAGRVFTSQHCKSSMDVRFVFVFAALSGPDYFDWLEKNSIAVFYEAMEKAGPHSINGMPIFLSHKHLTAGEWAAVLEKVQKIEKALQEI